VSTFIIQHQYLFGFWWKRNEKVALVAFLVSWAVACFATFAAPYLPTWYTNIHIAYQIAVISLVIMVIGNLVCEGKPGYFKSQEWFQSDSYRMYLEEKKNGNA